jgi:hypothetical protein
MWAPTSTVFPTRPAWARALWTSCWWAADPGGDRRPVPARCLGGADAGQLRDEDRDLNPVSRLTTAVALAEWITAHTNVIEVGPGEFSLPPKWTQTDIDGQSYRHPQCLRVCTSRQERGAADTRVWTELRKSQLSS